ncbi:NADH-quinone oxidoreductase subunit J [bacterium]|nr:NADH-quinone oxidoreductase subunit J [bacterium]
MSEGIVVMGQVNLFQVVVGILALAAAIGVVHSKSAVSSALSLMATLFLTAFLYFAKGAYFAGVVQVLIYAGAIAVLFVFIVMLLDLKPSRVAIPGQKGVALLAFAATAMFVVVVALLAVPGLFEPGLQESNLTALSAKAISYNFVSTYMLPFQATGFLILAAIVGVIMLAKSVRSPSNESRGEP